MIGNSLQELRYIIERQKGHRQKIMADIASLRQRLRTNKKRLERHRQAREIVRIVGLETQKRLQYHISDVTSLALETVYDDPYQLKIEFVQRRNKTECDIFFERNGERIDPMDESGGGAVDIASFALRVASWSMQRPRSNNVLILDEPFKNVSVDLLPRVSDMVKEISKQLNLQIIMVSHAGELIEEADKAFHIYISDGVSQLEE